MPPNGRTAEQVRREIEAEREELAGAVENLRGEIGHVTDMAGKVKQRLPVAAGATAALGLVLRATTRRAARRRKEEKAHAGRRSVRRR